MVRLKREDNPIPGEKPGYLPQYIDEEGTPITVTPSTPYPTKDNEVVAELKALNQNNQMALTAYDTAKNTQEQLNKIVIEGDSSVEAAQARVDKEGNSYTTLKERLDTEHEQTTAQLAQSEKKVNGKLELSDWELNSKTRHKSGMTIFISDDGRIEDYTVYAPIFKDLGVPAGIGVVSDDVGKTGYCTREQLLELQNQYGFEILSHSKSHPYGPPMADIPDNAFVEAEFRDSKIALQDMGFVVNNYVYPGGNYRDREKIYAQKYYRSARCSDGYPSLTINKPPLNTYELKTAWLDSLSAPLSGYLNIQSRAQAIQSTFNEMKVLIDQAKANSNLLIISTHMYNMVDADLQQLFRDVVAYAKANTTVTTLNKALNQMGNIVDIGNFNQMGKRVSKGKSHFVVGTNGMVSGSTTVSERDQFNFSSKYHDFVNGVTYVPISVAVGVNSPTGTAGILINYRIDDLDYQQNWQEFKPFYSDKFYIRKVINDTSYSAWVLQEKVHPSDENNRNLSTPITEFPLGTTYSIIKSDNPTIANAPEQRRGTLVTQKITNGADYSYNIQEYYINSATPVIYKRQPASDSTWTNWIKVSG